MQEGARDCGTDIQLLPRLPRGQRGRFDQIYAHTAWKKRRNMTMIQHVGTKTRQVGEPMQPEGMWCCQGNAASFGGWSCITFAELRH